MPAQPLTPEQKADAARLKEIFLTWKAERKRAGKPSSQEAAAEELGFGQSAFNQYVNGKIPLNPQAAAKFGELFGHPIEDFSPTIAAEAGKLAKATARTPETAPMDITQLSKIEAQLVLMFRDLTDEMRDEVVSHTNRLHNIVKPVKSAAHPWAHVAPPPSAAPKEESPATAPPPAKKSARAKKTEGVK